MLVLTATASAAPSADWRLAIVLVVLVALAITISAVADLGVGREHLTAAVRAVLQLAVISLIIAAALRSIWWSMAVLLMMFVVATATSGRRIGVSDRQLGWVGLAIGAGAAPVLALCLVSGVIPFNGPGIVPIGGILIGGMMTASTLTGRRASDELRSQFGAYEAGLSLGLQGKDAALLVIQPSAREALTPGLDQTRTVGLVTLPGAYIGVLLGGGSALEAASAQVLVLIGLMAGQAVTTSVLLHLIAAGRVRRADLAERPRQ